MFFLRKDLELFGKFATKPTIPNIRIVKQMLANLVPKAFPLFQRSRWNGASPSFTQTQNKGMFLYIPIMWTSTIYIENGTTSTRTNKRRLLIYFIQIHQKLKYTRNYAWIIWVWKRRKFTKAFIFIVRVIIVLRKWQISQFHSHFASYEQRLAAQITHWKTKKICDYPATPDSPVLKESLIQGLG